MSDYQKGDDVVSEVPTVGYGEDELVADIGKAGS